MDGRLSGQWKGKAIFDCLAGLRERRAGSDLAMKSVHSITGMSDRISLLWHDLWYLWLYL